MGFCDELLEALEATNNKLDHNLSLIERYMEMTSVEFSQKKESAEVRYVSEAQSEDALCTLSYLYTEAEEGFKEKVSAAIDKLMDTIRDYIMDVQNAVNKSIIDNHADEVLDTLEKRIHQNPFLKTVKVVFSTDKKRLALYGNLQEQYTKSIKYVQSGDVESLNKIVQNMEDLVHDAVKNSVLERVEDTVQNALKMCRIQMKEVIDFLDELKKDAKEVIENGKKLFTASGSPEILGLWQKIGVLYSRSIKITTNAQLNSFMDCMQAIETATNEKIDVTVKKAAGKKLDDDDEEIRLRDQAKKKDMSGEGYIREGSDRQFNAFMTEMFEGFLNNPVINVPDEQETEEILESSNMGLTQMINSKMSDYTKADKEMSLSSLTESFRFTT